MIFVPENNEFFFRIALFTRLYTDMCADGLPADLAWREAFRRANADIIDEEGL